MPPNKFTRRKFLLRASAAATGSVLASRLASAEPSANNAGPHQAMGTRVGEVTSTTAIIWTRLTANLTRRNDGMPVPDRTPEGIDKDVVSLTVPVDELEGACPGMPGRIRVRYGTKEDLSDAKTTPELAVSEQNDFIGEWKLAGLNPATVYHYASEVISPSKGNGSVIRGKFETAPKPEAPTNLRFCVMTCQGYPDRGHADGHDIYPSMLALAPQFACLTGDLVYYDNDQPRAVTPRLARYHWERMFSLPRLVEFTRNVGCYWLKDDHDTLKNDSWQRQTMGEFTFAEGEKIFRQQAPMDDEGLSYRTVRWGRDLQVWFTEGRDFRSPNNLPDGPQKTIWGEEQKAWFKRTVKESDATWRLLVSPTPLVGPDRQTGKSDNHSNKGFAHEGDEIRGWLRENAADNFFIICGDRHWQYHSVHPATGVTEFGVGPASNQHASGSPGFDAAYHKFHRVQGGFLSVSIKPEATRSTILFELRDIHGKVAYSWGKDRAAAHG